jgi:hypothetical protein
VCRCIASAMNGFGAFVFMQRRSDPRSVRVCPNHHFHPVLLSLTFSRTVNRRTTSYRGTPYLRTLTSRLLVSSSCSYHDASKHTWSRHERHESNESMLEQHERKVCVAIIVTMTDRHRTM